MLETEIKKLTEALTKNNELLTENNELLQQHLDIRERLAEGAKDDTVAPRSSGEIAEEKKPAPKKKATPKKEKTPKSDDGDVTHEDLRTHIKNTRAELRKGEGGPKAATAHREAFAALLEENDYASLPAIPEDELADFLEDVKAIEC